MTSRTQHAIADPSAVWRMIEGYAGYWALAAGVELGVFDRLDRGAADGSQLASACGVADPRFAVLLDALTALGVLSRNDDRYALTPLSEMFLVHDRARSMSDLVLRSPGVHENWPALASVLRGGSPPVIVDRDADAFYPSLVKSTFPPQYEVARRVATALEFDSIPSPVVLDLGTGAAPWASALLEANRSATAVCNDLPSVLAVAKDTLESHDLLERVTLLEGDYFTVDLPAAVDVVVLAHVCRAEGPDRAPALIARAASALRHGGRLVLADYLVDGGDPARSFHALTLGLTMIANTERGTTFTFADCTGWLEQAGLVDVALVESSPPTAVVVATKHVVDPTHLTGNERTVQ